MWLGCENDDYLQRRGSKRTAPEDRCHLNGFTMENGRARYVTAYSTGDAPES